MLTGAKNETQVMHSDMKYILLPVFLLTVNPRNAANFPMRNASGYSWLKVKNEGTGAFEENWTTGKWPMGIEPVVAFRDQLWMIGTAMCWSSPDGIEWTMKSKTNWGIRYGMKYIYFRNKLWMMGGMKDWSQFLNDIWSSEEGMVWKKVGNAPWSERRNHQLVVFQNKLWMFGGEVCSGKKDQLPSEHFTDVWSSIDGMNWKKELDKLPWQPDVLVKILVFKDRLWMIGGTHHREVWSSLNGINWKKESIQKTEKERTGYSVLAFDNKLWIIGGVAHSDSWYSENGIEWIRYADTAPWSSRSTTYSAVYKDCLWLFSGKTGRQDSWAGDIWALLKNK